MKRSSRPPYVDDKRQLCPHGFCPRCSNQIYTIKGRDLYVCKGCGMRVALVDLRRAPSKGSMPAVREKRKP